MGKEPTEAGIAPRYTKLPYRKKYIGKSLLTTERTLNVHANKFLCEKGQRDFHPCRNTVEDTHGTFVVNINVNLFRSLASNMLK